MVILQLFQVKLIVMRGKWDFAGIPQLIELQMRMNYA